MGALTEAIGDGEETAVTRLGLIWLAGLASWNHCRGGTCEFMEHKRLTPRDAGEWKTGQA